MTGHVQAEESQGICLIEESEPLTSMVRDRSWRPEREMNCSPEPSGITPAKPLPVLRFLSDHYPCYYCNIALHRLTGHLHSISWSQFWVIFCSSQSNQLDINLFYNNKQYSSFAQRNNQHPQHLLQNRVAFISAVRDIDSWQSHPPPADLLFFNAFSSLGGDQITWIHCP